MRITTLPCLIIALLFSSGALMADEVPSKYLGPFPRECAGPSRAALLLTADQVSSLNAAWQARQLAVAKIPKTDPDPRDWIRTIDREFDQKRDEILTEAQREFVVQLNGIYREVLDGVNGEFAQQIDAALTKDEKNRIMGERNKAVLERLLPELQAAIPADRFLAFKTAAMKGSN